MQLQSISAGTTVCLLALTACASYRPAPIEPMAVLDALDAVEWRASDVALATSAVGPRELAAFAVHTNPTLVAARAELGVRQALLVQAGLLPDPEIGWDAMNVLAAQAVNGSSTSVDALSGFSLMFPLLRPGERGARVGAARWKLEEVRSQIAATEWVLTRDVHLAYEELRAAALLLAQTRAVAGIAEETAEHFRRAREAGAATAIQANLALGELQSIRLQAIRAEIRERVARQELNAFLGLPPATELTLLADRDPGSDAALSSSAVELAREAVTNRPDLAALQAGYQAAEEEVRLAVARQFPLVSVGTGLSIDVPVFSRFGGPALQTALAQRTRLGKDLEAAIFSARAEVAESHLRWEFARRELDLVERELLPNAERNLELTQQALAVGEVTLLETLALQRSLVEARTRHTEARAERAKTAWRLLAASGRLLGTPNETQRIDPRGGTR